MLYNKYNSLESYDASRGDEMGAHAFGELLKKHRRALDKTLREFCLENGFDPGNYSRLERGMLNPPQRGDLLEKYAVALKLKRDSEDWLELFDLAAAAHGQLPKDLLSDEELLGKLPLLFRTLRGSAVSPAKLDELIEKIRRS